MITTVSNSTNSSKTVYEYPTPGNNSVVTTDYSKNTANGPYEFSQSRKDTYNPADQLINTTYLRQSYYLESTQYDYSYQNNNLISRIKSEFNNATQSWENDSKYSYTYDSNGNITETNYQSWVNNQWQPPLSISVYSYTSNDKLLKIESFRLINGSWTLRAVNGYSYSNNYQDVTITHQNVDQYGNYTNYVQYISSYNTFGDLTYEEVKVWEMGMWIQGTKDEYTYDQNNNLIGYSWYQVDSQNNYYLSLEDNYTYDNAHPASVLLHNLEETKGRHQLLTFERKAYNQSTGQMEPARSSICYWTDLQVSNENIHYNSDEITLFPNPASDVLNIELPSTTLPADLTLFDATGRVTKQMPIQDGKVAVKGLPTGFFSYLIEVQDELYTGKLIIKD